MKIDWISHMKEENSVNENWSIFRNKIQEIEDKFVPTKTIKHTKNNKHRFPVDQGTLEKIRKKHSLSKEASATKDPDVRKKYNKVRNQVKRMTRKLRKDFENNLAIKAKSDPKFIWKYIDSKTKSKVEIGDLYENPGDNKSTKATTDKEKSDILACFFQSVFVKEEVGETLTLPSKETVCQCYR